ncbi:MAG TPA: hypothetical protein VFU12_06125 [Glycomyces sp.]|nr:hypothetical protein [Glycomyces sp.]
MHHDVLKARAGLRRIEPEPAVEPGYIKRIDSPFARLYRAERPAAIWAHAARHESEADG